MEPEGLTQKRGIYTNGGCSGGTGGLYHSASTESTALRHQPDTTNTKTKIVEGKGTTHHSDGKESNLHPAKGGDLELSPEERSLIQAGRMSALRKEKEMSDGVRVYGSSAAVLLETVAA